MTSQNQSKAEEKTSLGNMINELVEEKRKKEESDKKKKDLINSLIDSSHKT